MRKVQAINGGWAFHKGDTKRHKIPKKVKKGWEAVELPHTWNALDGQDGGFDYYRGACWYFKELDIFPKNNEEIYLEIPAASLTAEVYINGNAVCTHKGGFSTFRVNITPYLNPKKATKIAICVSNSENKEVYPQTADFTFFGGLYRGVNLISVDKAHFDLDYEGGCGVSVTPELNEDGSADIDIEAFVKNAEGCRIQYRVENAVVDGEKATLHIENPHLWNGRMDPYLYTLDAQIVKNNIVIDNVSVKFGIRSFHIDAEKGFFLNGKPYPLHGVSRHQDRQDMGWAITEKEHKEDMELIAELGANTIRLAHYQHNQYFYDLCDEYGMIVWAEIPFISAFMNTPEAKENTLSQMKELIIQNYNHPSIICWGIANEITIGGEDPALVDNLNALNDLCHQLDSTRPTTMAQLTMVEMNSPLNKITDILSYNHYFGWYMGSVEDNAVWIDKFHQLNPTICLGISEYGSEGILKYHNDNPQMQDYSEEYQAYYHEEMLKTFAERPYLWSTHVWNMFDFASDMRDEGGVKGRNNKGLVTFDRKIKKDSFFVYKAYWSDEKFVHLCGSRYVNRPTEKTDIKVYSNCDEITLYVNGEEKAKESCDKIVVFKDVELTDGENTIKAVCGELADEMIINRVSEPDESYVLKISEAGNSGTNWFDTLEADSEELQFPEGYFSIKDKLGEIMKNPEGEKFINEMVEKITTEMGMNISKGMMNMAKGFTIEKVFDMAGSRVPAKVKPWVNNKLNQIKK
ncbi:MAG: glycoside hydrolase family 2 protein [Eubacterium sp.]|nr:glycoside hydrolase family 2 protein [Eubacterium sp.]